MSRSPNTVSTTAAGPTEVSDGRRSRLRTSSCTCLIPLRVVDPARLGSPPTLDHRSDPGPSQERPADFSEVRPSCRERPTSLQEHHGQGGQHHIRQRRIDQRRVDPHQVVDSRRRSVAIDHPLDVDVLRIQACRVDHRVLHPVRRRLSAATRTPFEHRRPPSALHRPVDLDHHSHAIVRPRWRSRNRSNP